MNRITVAALAAFLALGPRPGNAQPVDGTVMSAFDGLAESIVRIRTVADLGRTQPKPGPRSAKAAVRPYSVDGSGVVIGRTVVDGRTEYLILTNHHVADASNYVLEEGGYLRVNPSNTLAVPSVPEASYILETPGDSVAPTDVALIELVRLVRGDMALMRTSGASRELTVFEGAIGYRKGEIVAGAPIVTSGYPWGGERITAAGTIEEVGYVHELGLPHTDFVVDVPVEPGQSGGPIFLVERSAKEASPRFRLIGLVHAKDRDRNFAVPYDLWAESLDEFPEEIQARMVR
jgi:S1-C subfamily serine protease